MKKISASLAVLAVSVTLAACGGSSNNSGPRAETRTFESSLINGVSYSTPTRSGTTGVDCIVPTPGCFDVIPGEPVTFTIGNIVLPPVVAAPGQTRITVLDVAATLGADSMQSTPARIIVAALKGLDPERGATKTADGKTIYNVSFAGAAAPVQLAALTASLEEDEEVSAVDFKSLLSETLGIPEEDIDFDAALETDLAKDELGFVGGPQPNDELFEEPGLPLVVSDLLGLWTTQEQTESGTSIGGIFFGNDGLVDFISTIAGNNDESDFNLGDSWNVKDNQLVVLDSDGSDTTDCIVKSRATNTIILTCIDVQGVVADNGNNELIVVAQAVSEAPESYEITLTKVDNLAGILTASGGLWNMVFEERFEETGTITFRANGTYTDTVDPTTATNGTFMIDRGVVVLKETEGDGSSSCYFAGLTRNMQNQVQDILFRCLSEDEDEEDEEDLLLTKRNNVAPLADTDNRRP